MDFLNSSIEDAIESLVIVKAVATFHVKILSHVFTCPCLCFLAQLSLSFISTATHLDSHCYQCSMRRMFYGSWFNVLVKIQLKVP